MEKEKQELVYNHPSFQIFKTKSFLNKYCVFIKDKKRKILIGASITKRGAKRILDKYYMIYGMLQDKTPPQKERKR